MAGGRLGDTLGQEPVLKVSMVAFNIFTLICALVRNKIGFLIARALQGTSLLPCSLAHQIVFNIT
jgi:MFS family permease